MKTVAVLSTLALALPAFAAPAPSATPIHDSLPCPGVNGKILTSSNFIGYKVTCKSTLDTKVIREVDATNGIQTCLTACDGTTGCEAVTYKPTSADQLTGKCFVRGASGKQTTGTAGEVVAVPLTHATSTLAWPSAATTSAPATTYACNPAHSYPNNAKCISSGTGLTLVTPTPSAASSSKAPASAAPTGAFIGLSIRSGSAIQYSNVNANGTNFWLNQGSEIYCPEGISCSNTTSTQFIGGTDTLGLDTVVPGGQRVYVDSSSALRFTSAHSAAIPDGSHTSGFSLKEGLYLQFNGTGFVACPRDAGAYIVFADAAQKVEPDCVGFEFRVAASTGEAVWQYV